MNNPSDSSKRPNAKIQYYAYLYEFLYYPYLDKFLFSLLDDTPILKSLIFRLKININNLNTLLKDYDMEYFRIRMEYFRIRNEKLSLDHIPDSITVDKRLSDIRKAETEKRIAELKKRMLEINNSRNIENERLDRWYSEKKGLSLLIKKVNNDRNVNNTKKFFAIIPRVLYFIAVTISLLVLLTLLSTLVLIELVLKKILPKAEESIYKVCNYVECAILILLSIFLIPVALILGTIEQLIYLVIDLIAIPIIKIAEYFSLKAQGKDYDSQKMHSDGKQNSGNPSKATDASQAQQPVHHDYPPVVERQEEKEDTPTTAAPPVKAENSTPCTTYGVGTANDNDELLPALALTESSPMQSLSSQTLPSRN